MPLEFSIQPDSVIKNGTEVNKDLIHKTLQFHCTDELFYFWQEYEHLLFDNGISIYGYSLALERNEQYEVAIYLKGYLLIGDNGSGRGLFIQKEDSELLLYYLDLGALGSIELEATNQNLFQWIEKNPDLEQYDDISESDVFYEEADLFVINVPEKKNQFLFKLKKTLYVDESIVSLSGKMNALPFVVKENFYPIKYRKEILELNKRYNYLQLKTKDGKPIDL